MRIYWTNVEFTFQNTHPDYGKYKGGEVFAFVESKDSENALKRFKEELHKLHYSPFDFEFIKPYELTLEWEEKSEAEKYKDIYNLAKNSTNVIFDDFYVYEKID